MGFIIFLPSHHFAEKAPYSCLGFGFRKNLAKVYYLHYTLDLNQYSQQGGKSICVLVHNFSIPCEVHISPVLSSAT